MVSVPLQEKILPYSTCVGFPKQDALFVFQPACDASSGAPCNILGRVGHSEKRLVR